MNHPNHELFGRDAHVTLLALERLDAGELDAHACVQLGDHLDRCPVCNARAQALTNAGEALAPPVGPRSEAGNATVASLLATAAIAVAATTILGLGASLLPSPQPAHERTSEPLPMAGAYTSVAHEVGEPVVPEVELVVRGDRAELDVHGDGVVALVIADAQRVATIVAAPRATDEGITTIALPAGTDRHRLIAVLCPEPFALAPGDELPPEPDCIVTTR